MIDKANDFYYSDAPEPHISRTKEILKKYPEIKNLMGRNPTTIYYIVGVVAFQVLMAYLVSDLQWWMVLLAAYCIGAFANHACFVLIHECTHNLVFKSRTGNLWAGILCDLPNGFPSSTEFRKFHLKHHAFQGHHDLDADLPSRWEARLIGNSVPGKALWLLLFPLFQISRKFRLTEIQGADRWTWINIGSIILVDVVIIWLWGPMALVYLIGSLFFAIGLHPLGARWIQEHYLVAYPQETYSYYGPINKLAFNVGYHNEHHDFSFVAWNNLPKIRAIAPEYYDTLVYHTSWTKLLFQWLWKGDLSLFSRVLRENRAGMQVSSKGEKDFFSGMQKKELLTVDG